MVERQEGKGDASLTLGEVVRHSRQNYPESRFHPKVFAESSHYPLAGIYSAPFPLYMTADGVGTKPELAERLYTASVEAGKPDPSVFESLAFDTLAMIDGDEARFGRFMVAVANILDVNSAKNPEIIGSLAKGLFEASRVGHFAILNGETAELGYRTSGYGDNRLNWNAVGLSVIVEDKLLVGKDIEPGQPIVALRESSIRSNGLSKARAILEAGFLLENGFESKIDYVHRKLADRKVIFNALTIADDLRLVFGHDAIEQVLPPWHELYPDITKELLMPSTIYGPAMYNAQFGVDGDPAIKMIAAAHITGGGIPEKTLRMLKPHGLGAKLYRKFDNPEAVTSLLKLVDSYPPEIQKRLNVTPRTALEQWNPGVGFLIVTKDMDEAEACVELIPDSAIIGETTYKHQIEFDEHVWTYESTPTP